MRLQSSICCVAAVAWCLVAAASQTPAPPSREAIEQDMALRSVDDRVRGQRDGVGFVLGADAAEDVVSTALRLESAAISQRDDELGISPEQGYLGGVCPHDDHLYAGRAYVHLTERISAPRVILVGVFHAARMWDLEDRLVFESFESWHGPWGPVPVDPLRGLLVSRLPAEVLVVDNAMHCREHSLEALIPFLQYGHPERSIVPILVPYASWERLSELATELSSALADLMEERGWQLGRDLAIVVSSDAVHYGPDFDHAPFGTDAAGYQRAVARDLDLAHWYLEGPLEAEKLEAFELNLVARGDLRGYTIPWCGRFSIPFGLELLRQTAVRTGVAVPEGHLLRYATSLSEPLLPVAAATMTSGLGTTAPSNLHHWVGYVTVGFTAGDGGSTAGE